MSQSQPYIYHSLDQSRREVRLVRVLNLDEILFVTKTIESDLELHGDPDRVRAIEADIPIRCAINHVSLEDRPVYAALSYSWGDTSNKRRIIIEEDDKECELLITKNLHSALRHIGLDGQFWIDAVCINQADDTEKSWQVQQMWAIFHGAEYVAAWLGLAADDSDLVLAQIADVPEMRARDIDGYPDLERLQKLVNWRPPTDFLSLFAFSALTKRSYWRRVWIQQELQASQNVWFHCGSKKIHLSLIDLALGLLHRLHEDLRRMKLGAVRRDSFEANLSFLKSDESMLIASAAIKLHKSRIRKGTLPLASLLKGTYIFRKGLEASDPRDRIFAFLGMSADAADLCIVPDYSKTKSQVFTEVAMALIQQMGLEVLTWCHPKAPPREDCYLPSWAPDWSSAFSRPLGKFGRETNFRYMASGDSTARFQFLDSSNEFPILCASGIKVDEIFAVGQALTQVPVSDLTWLTNGLDPNYQLQQEWLSDIERLSKHCGNRYGSSQALEDAVWRTPITDLEFTSAGEYRRASSSMQKGHLLYRTGFFRATMSQRELQQRSDDIGLIAMYWRPMVSRSSGRKYFVSQRGYLGVGPSTISPGDVIAIVLGLDTPLVLRAIEKDHYQIVGEAYVHGIMDGELMEDSLVQDFEIC
jgi:hypothetical protein